MKIVLELTSLTQAEVIAKAVDQLIDCEEARRSDAMVARKRGEGDASDWTKADDATLAAAKQVLAMIRPEAK